MLEADSDMLEVACLKPTLATFCAMCSAAIMLRSRYPVHCWIAVLE